nr:integrase, catalytic region, zinc finger, CCHC-type, peptidase aspartic, catalytic [Tanacetum cinerariifolium]
MTDKSIITPDHPLYLHQIDHPGLILIPKKLTGFDNYGSWRRSMVIALYVKNKYKIATREYPEPCITYNTRALWERNNDMIISWILNVMTTLAEHIIVVGAENRPLMLKKSMYDSWASRIRLFIKGKKHGRMMLDSMDNRLLVYPTVKENGQTRPKKYFEFTEAQQLQDDYDVQATNIILYGFLPDVCALVNHRRAAKDIWDRVKMLMKGIELSYQEREFRLYNLFDKYAHVPGETLYEYHWRFFQLINDMHTIGMSMQQV